MQEIQLHGKYGEGKVTLVDDRDYAYLNQWKWGLSKQNPYPIRNDSGNKIITMHRVIMSAKGKEMFVDHIDGDGLNNQRDNLRLSTNSQNQMNRHKTKGNSKYKGVSLVPYGKSHKWRPSIFTNNKKIQVFVNTETEAAKTYNQLAEKYFGEFAHLNKIEN